MKLVTSETQESVQVALTRGEWAVLFFAAREFRNQVLPARHQDLETGLAILHEIVAEKAGKG